MRIFFLRFFMLFVVIIGCQDKAGNNPRLDEDSNVLKTAITKNTIQDFEFSDYALSSQSEKVVANWDKYQELAIQVSYLRQADLSFFNGEKSLLKGFTDTLKLNIPDTLKTNPIFSRTTIVETALLRLNDNLTLDNISDSLKLQGVKEVLVAFSNLNYQINKKLEKDLYSKIESQF